MATALESPDFFIAPVCNECCSARIATKKVLANIGTAFGFECLVITIGGAVHQIDEGAITISCKEFIPLAAPDDFDDIPTRATENRFEFLNNFAVTSDRTIEALQVAVDNKVEIIESFTRCQTNSTESFWFIALAITQKCPNVLI